MPNDSWHIVQMPKRSSIYSPAKVEESSDRIVKGKAREVRVKVDGEKNPHAVALGRLGGQKGGVARANSLTAKRRREIAKAAAVARWKTNDS